MITRERVFLELRDAASAPEAAQTLEREGFAVLRGAFAAKDLAALASEIERVYETVAADVRNPGFTSPEREDFRYEMLNRSAAVQRGIGHPTILETIEPLLGEDCHVIANTAWRQGPDENNHGGRFWHIDSGPHVPRPVGVPWDERIPYPVFAIAAHILLMDCPIEAGPTGVLPGSHTSGQAPPRDRLADDNLTWEGREAVPLTGAAGDVALFVSDVWHRRLPSRPGDPGRYFQQVHYGRRDIAQRLRTTADANQLDDDAVARAATRRERTLIGLHDPFFYDG